MAKQPNIELVGRLNAIVKGKLHESYKTPGGAEVLLLAQAAASELLNSGVIELLPPALPMNQYGRSEEKPRKVGQQVWLLQERCRLLASLLEQMKGVPPDSQTGNSRQEQLAEFTSALLEVAAPFLAAHQGRNLQDKSEQLDKLLTQGRKTLAEVSAIRDTTRQAAGEVGAGLHANTFAELADIYKTRSKVALGFTIGMAIVLVVAVVFVYCLAVRTTGLDHVQAIQVGVAKLVGLSVLYFLLVLAARAYKANAHLYAVNQHRASALTSFEAFVKSASDAQTKSAVLLEATRCIYTHVASGYLGAEPPTSPLQFMEVMKAGSQ